MSTTKCSTLLGNPDLPIHSSLDKLYQTFMNNQVIFIKGETGSGKSTQIPQYCLEWLNAHRTDSEFSRVLVTQPRRMAAVSLATHMADSIREKKGNIPWLDTYVHTKKDELKNKKKGAKRKVKNGFKLGGIVGYNIRFDRLESSCTGIKFVTDGVLLRMVLANPKLLGYDVIVIDEAHERSLRTDMCLSRIRLILSSRPNLKVIIMSATLKTDIFINLFSEFKHAEVSISGM